jgi:adenylate cyclase, class 2
MNEEIEVKLYVRDLARVEARLREAGAKLIEPRAHEHNLRFDLPDGSLRAGRRAVRLRQSTDARLTYKGPSENREGIMARTEIEFSVSDFEAAKYFLESLGYLVVAVYEKFRATYEFDSAHVMLDELPYGHFVEIEGADTDSIRAVASRLHLDVEAAIPASYLTLFERLAEEQKLDPSHLTFAALTHLPTSPEMLHVRPADVR